jgi:hypothetical protein
VVGVRREIDKPTVVVVVRHAVADSLLSVGAAEPIRPSGREEVRTAGSHKNSLHIRRKFEPAAAIC